MATSRAAAVAAAEPASEAEALAPPNEPLQLTFTSGNPSDRHEIVTAKQDLLEPRQENAPAQERIRARFKKVPGRSITSAPDDYTRVIGLLVVVRDELELAGRSPGDLVTITRQANDSLINDLAIVARLIRKMAER